MRREVEDEAVGGTLSAADLRRAIESAQAGKRQRTRFALLRGLDAALGHANPLLTDVAPAALAEYALRYAESGRFDSGAIPGGLLPRFARPGRRGQLPDASRTRSARWSAFQPMPGRRATT